MQEPSNPSKEPPPAASDLELQATSLAPTILCIDDNRVGLAVRKALLESKGYSVLTAEDGSTGLSLLLTRNNIDALVLDIRMAGMSGEAVASIICNELPDLPIVLLTGIPERLRQPKLAELADAVITKGESPQVLLDVLERLTGTERESSPRVSRAVEEARSLREQTKATRSEKRRLLEDQKQAG